MLFDTATLLNTAREHSFAIGGFNIYNLEGATAVIQAAEELQSPVILQMLPSALELGGSALIAMCYELGRVASVPVSLHLDHCGDLGIIKDVIDSGLTSIMADGSDLDFHENLLFSSEVSRLLSPFNGCVEAELGKISGEEDGITTAALEEKLTDPEQAAFFVEKTGVTALAVCIGNVHGTYHSPPKLDYHRLEQIRKRVTVPLVLHGTSGLPDDMITKVMDHGVCKFNVNTEVRKVYLKTVRKSLATSSSMELVPLMGEVITAMKVPVQEKMHLFCSANKAQMFNNL